jgi:hypothetical protein
MPFFQFRQNNSGGIFKEDKKRGIGLAVIVEAKTVNEANRRAKSIGLYFDGCSTGQDCSCCGDRWSEAWDKKGDAVPSMYGEPIAKAAKKNKERSWDTWYGMHVAMLMGVAIWSSWAYLVFDGVERRSTKARASHREATTHARELRHSVQQGRVQPRMCRPRQDREG